MNSFKIAVVIAQREEHLDAEKINFTS